MRLGQFARKYDIRVQDIISYLENSDEEIHSNTKLSEEDETEILDFFGIEAEEEIEVIESPKVIEVKKQEPLKGATEIKEEKVVVDEDAWIDEDEPVIVEKIKEEKKEVIDSKPTPRIPATPEEDIALAEGEIDFMPIGDNQDEEITVEQELEEQPKKVISPTASEKKLEPKEDEVIDTERLMELLESEEASPELDKIKLIKAPKKELSGLKVLGKVDLPEPKKKEVNKEEEAEQETGANRRNDRPKISDEEREKRRLKAKQKREEFEAREKRRLKEKEEKEKRDRNASHYKQKLNQPKPKKKKQKSKKAETAAPIVTLTPPTQKAKVKKEQPTSAIGKMWKWLTNPD